MIHRFNFVLTLAAVALATSGPSIAWAGNQSKVTTNVPIGSTSWSQSVAANQTVQVFTGSQNTAGIAVRTISVTCANNFSVVAINPNTSLYTVATCNPSDSGQQLSVNQDGLYLAAGWGLELSAGTAGGSTGNQVTITYDVQ